MPQDPWLVHVELDADMEEAVLAKTVRDRGGTHVQGVYGTGDGRHYMVHLEDPRDAGGHGDPVEAIKQGLPGGTFTPWHWCT
jgi:hypothetical protein